MIGLNIDIQPAFQRFDIDTPPFRHIANIICAYHEAFVHDLYSARFAVEGECAALLEQPASCAARLLVEPDRQIECHDDIGQIDADAGIGLIATDTVAHAVLADANIEQQCIIVAGLPTAGKRRRSRDRNDPHCYGHRHQRLSAIMIKLAHCRPWSSLPLLQSLRGEPTGLG